MLISFRLFKIAKYFDLSLCVMRANHTTNDVVKFLIDLKKENVSNLRLVLNGVVQAQHTDINMDIIWV